MDRLTLSYKEIGDTTIHFDIYPPSTLSQQLELISTASDLVPRVPAVVYFHGGGLTVGNRNSWLPTWLQRRVTDAGYAFISADYRLLPPATGHDILTDIKDLFTFVSSIDFSSHLDVMCLTRAEVNDCYDFPKFHIDPYSIAVAGTSSGGLCAYLAAMHVSPKPRAVLSLYGMGGDFLTPHYVIPKSAPFFRGRELLDSAAFSEYLYPFSSSQSTPTSLESISDSPLSYHPDTSATPGYPANPRMLLTRLYLQLGLFLDYYTGQHEPSLSSTLREILSGKNPAVDGDKDIDFDITNCMRHLIPEHHLHLFPQFGVTSDWPPTLLCHGSFDTAVPVHESRHMQELLDRAGVPGVQLVVIEGKEHSFDYDPKAEALYGKQFDLIVDFLKVWLEPRKALEWVA